MFNRFMEYFKQLSDKGQFLVTNMLCDLDHGDNLYNHIDYAESFYFARLSADMTIDDLCYKVAEKQGLIQSAGSTQEKREAAIAQIRSAVVSAMQRNSKRSAYYNDILDVLKTDEIELERYSSYFRKRFNDIDWLFHSVTERNQKAIINLTVNLLVYEHVNNSNNENNTGSLATNEVLDIWDIPTLPLDF